MTTGAMFPHNCSYDFCKQNWLTMPGILLLFVYYYKMQSLKIFLEPYKELLSIELKKLKLLHLIIKICN